MRRLALTPVQQDLVAAYATELRALRLGSSARELVWGARVFCTRFDQPSDWARLPLVERLSHNIKVHRFVAWLAATGRLRLDAAIRATSMSSSWSGTARRPRWLPRTGSRSSGWD